MADDDSIDEVRRDALTSFLEAKVREGYLVETRTDTHAIIAPTGWSSIKASINPFRKATGRLVISVDDHGKVTTSPAEPLRS